MKKIRISNKMKYDERKLSKCQNNDPSAEEFKLKNVVFFIFATHRSLVNLWKKTTSMSALQ